jgi:hypothetical protein
MFYIEQNTNALRFGDVLKGFPITTPKIEQPVFSGNYKNCNIQVNFGEYFVVMDPCCSIGEKLISLTPLIRIIDFFENPFLREDLTRVNSEMEPQQSVSPTVWNSFPQLEKDKRLKIGKAYAFVNLFVYAPLDEFSEYKIDNKRREQLNTKYYMINFRNIFKVNCDKVVAPKNFPMESKVRELSIETRGLLRNKIAYYYGRVPEEDKIFED